MAIHFTANQYIYRSTSPIPAGASTASISFFLQVNDPGPVPAEVIGLLGDRNGAQVQVSQRNSGTNTFYFHIQGLTNATYIFSPEAGRAYHFAFAYDSASGGGIYQDGILVLPIIASGVMGDPGSNGFWAGLRRRDLQSIVTQHDITIDDIAIWNGYKLSATDVAALRDRTATPDAVGGASLVHWTTLDGTTGNNVAASDAGLTDQSGSSTHWSSVGGAPVYAEALAYIHPAELESVRVGTSGKTVVAWFRSALTQEPAPISALDWVTPLSRATLQHGDVDNNETQEVSHAGYTSGTFTMTYEGVESGLINFDASAAAVQAALEAIPALTGNITCTGGPMGSSPVQIEFINALALTDASPVFIGQNNLDAPQSSWVKINGSSAVNTNAQPIFYSNYIIFFLDSVVDPVDTVTFSFGEQTIQSSGGYARAETDVAVSNQVGQTLLQGLPGPGRTLQLGYNDSIVALDGYDVACNYADLMKTNRPGWHPEGASEFRNIHTAPESYDGKGYEALGLGDYTLIWNGPGNVWLDTVLPDSRPITLKTDDPNLGVDTEHRRVYTLGSDPDTIQTWLRAYRDAPNSGATATSDIRIYPPGVDPDNPGKWHPRFLERLSGAACIRSMENFHINSSSIALFSDFTPELYDATNRTDSYSSEYTHRFVGPVNISTVEAYNGTDVNNVNRVHLLFTTDQPHGILDGQVVDFVGVAPVLMDDGSNVQPSSGVVRVKSATTFAYSIYNGVGNTADVDGVQTPGGTVSVDIRRTIPIADFFDIANAVDCDVWFCVPHAMADDQVRLLAQDVVPRVPAGRKLYLEWTNEHWNFGGQFQQFNYVAAVASGYGLPHTKGYAQRASEVHTIFEEELSAIGRGGDLVRVFGIQPDSDSQALDILQYAANEAAVPFPVDCIAHAPYYRPTDDGDEEFHGTFDQIDVDQILDVSEVTVDRYGDRAAYLKGVIASSPVPGARLIMYEGGMEMGVPNAAGNAERSTKSRKWSVHPRIRGIVLRYLQVLEAGGVDYFTYFNLAQSHHYYYNANKPPDAAVIMPCAVWGAYISYDQEPGLGDGSDGKFNNLSDPEAFGDVVSVIGQGINEWIALTQAAPVPLVGRRRLAGPGSTRAGRGSPLVHVSDTRRAD